MTEIASDGAAARAPRAAGAQTLERGLRALQLLADSPAGLTATPVAARLDVHRSVAYRLLQALERTGFAARGDGSRYRVGAGVVALGERVRPGLRQAAEPILHDHAERLGATASLVVRDGDDAVAIAVVEPSHGTHLSYRVGSRGPLDRGAGSVAVQAAGPARDDDGARVSAARRSGYVLSSEEVTPGTHAVAAPVRTNHPDGPAAVNLITHRRDTAEAAVDAVVAAAARIAAALG